MEQITINNLSGPSKAMKMSFSCSSLQRSSDSLEGPEHAGIRVDRPYNSLTKKRKEPKQEHCQRTWGSREDCRDDFWAAIRSNYDYIMDTDLIDSCKEANGELVWDEGDVSTLSWGLKEVSCQFSELYSWLGVLQEMVYSKEENLLDKSLRAAHMEELRRKAYRRRLFNEQAGKLVCRAPTLKDEVAWRVDHLNAKWELVEQIMAPATQPTSDQQDISADFEHEVKCLRKWLREMESRLQPLSFRIDWTRSELEEKATEHMVLQRDIEAHGRIVSSVVKLGERVARQQREQQRQRDREQRDLEESKREEDTEQQQQQQQLQVNLHSERAEQQIPPASRVASSLERRWHLLFLRALEWQCHIETLATRLCSKNVSCRCSSDSDEEPVTKQPRLSRRQSRESGRESSGQTGGRSSRGSGIGRRVGSARRRAHREHNVGASSSSSSSSSCSDSDMSSENRVIDDESYFEDDLEELCVTESKPREIKTIEKLSSSPVIEDQGEEGDVEEEGAVSEEERDEMPPIPGPAATSSADEVDGITEAAEIPLSNGSTVAQDIPKRRRTLDESASFSTTDRKSKNCATFYFKHLDTDSEADCGLPSEEMPNGAEESSEEEWTYTASPSENYQARYEERKANVVVRLDFGEPPVIERIENIEFKRVTPGTRSHDIAANGNNNVIPEEDAKFEQELNDEEEKKRRDENESDDETKNDIQRLILEVEKLVREEGRSGVSRNLPPLIFEGQGPADNYRAKYARIKEWLRLNSTHSHDGRSTSQSWLQPLDSCDASGEYTTGESDVEKESVSSEDLQSSVATYRRFEGGLGGCVSQSVSQEIFNDNEKTLMNESQSSSMETSTPKVVMRSKRKSDGPRPWSVSCVFQIAEAAKMNSTNDTISQFSISETALHQLVATPPTKSVSLDATGSCVPFNNSTSTLLEENVSGQDGRTVRDSSLRKKKSRLRKKTVCGGSIVQSGSDGSSNQQRSSVRRTNRTRTIRTISRDCNGRLTTLVKSGSFSGCTAKQEMSSEKSIVSDPTPPVRLSCCRSDTSTADTEDNTCCTHNTRSCSVYEENPLDVVPISAGALNGDSDVEKNSLGNNSFSEQAWDSYQEKYMSEPYSETADVETARRLLDFGDDYRNFLDSQSDCASSMSAVRSSSPPAASSRIHSDIADSSEESDSEDIRRIVERSHKKLVDMETHFSRISGVRGSKDNMEVECICKENIKCLKSLVESGGGCLKGEKSVKQVRGLTERWESLSARAEEAQRASALQREMAAMHLEFRAAHERLIAHEVVLEPAHVLDDRINQITSELASLRERKAAMLALNVSAHRLITDLGAAATSVSVSLKDAVADLYRVWDETFQRGNQQLCALQAVQQFSARLTELQCALRRDKDTLAVLDAALQAGATTEVASSVRDVARLLSEKQEVCQNGAVTTGTPEDELTGPNGLKFNDATVMSLAQEGGTFSDSGISDSGSEQELSERERRLAALRRLTRTLESQLAPGSDALVELWKRVEDAEAELRSLQKQCRELIVRTAASVEARAVTRNSSSQVKFVTNKRKKRAASSGETDAGARKAKGGMTDADDPEDEPNLPKSWVWRILRAALPFQLALVALFCAACLLEPHCCEAANTLNLSLTPQLRYVRGPPPV